MAHHSVVTSTMACMSSLPATSTATTQQHDSSSDYNLCVITGPDRDLLHYQAELAQQQRDSVPLAQLSSDPVNLLCDGAVALDENFLCEILLRSTTARTAVRITRALVDTGAQTSVISEATVTKLMQTSAAKTCDLIQLTTPRYVQSWDKKGPVRAVTQLAILHITATAPDGLTPAVFEHSFLVLPHCTKPVSYTHLTLPTKRIV